MGKEITFRNQRYRLRGFDELTGKDWRTLTELFDLAASDITQLSGVIRSANTMLCANAIPDLQDWPASEREGFFIQAMFYLSDSLAEGGKVMDRWSSAYVAILESLKKLIPGVLPNA